MRQRVCLSDPVRVQAQFQLESACFRAERILVFQTGKDLLRIMQPPFVQSAPHIFSQCRNDQPGHPLSLSWITKDRVKRQAKYLDPKGQVVGYFETWEYSPPWQS